MRLWHQDLIPYLPNKQLGGLHSEICGMRGNGWGRKHRIVDYVFTHSPARLFAYHMKVMMERKRRGLYVDDKWLDSSYRGKKCEPYKERILTDSDMGLIFSDELIYPEQHNQEYLQECLSNLETKGIYIDMSEVA